MYKSTLIPGNNIKPLKTPLSMMIDMEMCIYIGMRRRSYTEKMDRKETNKRYLWVIFYRWLLFQIFPYFILQVSSNKC